MATAATSLLGLALPVTGELSGSWGTTVNDAITSLLDTAVAGTTTLSSDADVTLTTTTLASNQARQAVILWTAGGTVTRNITAPAQSKVYVVINASSSTQSIVLRGVGPTTGVTIAQGEKAVCAWNGTDFIKVSNISGAGVFSSITNTGLTSGRVVFSTTNGLETDSANLTFNGTILTAAGFAGPLNGTVGATTANTGAFSTLSATGVATFSAGTAALPAITTTGDTNTGIFFPAADTIAFSEGGAEAMRIDSSGNVGIGNTAANVNDQVGAVRPLLVSKSDAVTTIAGSQASIVIGNSNTTTSNTSQLSFAALTGANSNFYTSAAINCIFGARTNGQYPTGQLAFSTSTSLNSAPTEKMRITSAGDVGIGTVTPAYKLDVAGSVNVSSDSSYTFGAGADRFIKYRSSNNDILFSFDSGDFYQQNIASSYHAWFTGNNERVRISAAGGLSVGTTSDPGAGAIYATGNITAYFSDDRLKTKLGNIQDALSKVKALSGFYYEANQTAQDLGYKPVREAGVSAQQVQAVMPEVVKPAPIDAQYLTVDYERLVPLLIEAIKELDAKIEGLVKA